MQAVKAYGRERGVPPSTVFVAIDAVRSLRPGIDPQQADRDWFEAYAAQAERIAAGASAR